VQAVSAAPLVVRCMYMEVVPKPMPAAVACCMYLAVVPRQMPAAVALRCC
jgi:hypothetical protein